MHQTTKQASEQELQARISSTKSEKKENQHKKIRQELAPENKRASPQE